MLKYSIPHLIIKWVADKAIILVVFAASLVSLGEVQSTSTLNDWARYVNKINRQDWT